jgi:molybdopterin-dependent oxidoreductase alpha subunit
VGLPAVINALRYTARTAGLGRGVKALVTVNQPDGFDCPGCAWPDPEPRHRATAEFCENGARAVAHEADRRRVDRAFFAEHSVSSLRARSDHDLEQQGRLVEPMIRRPGSDHYEPITYDDAFRLLATELQGLSSPDRAAFYTSGRTSNEAAFLYQLFVRAFGTNNLPDCSNMCHESSGKGLGSTIGVGKGTVTLSDFDESDCIFIIGQNPGTNHPRMLSTLLEAAERGASIVSVNPLRERALERFAHPQRLSGLLGIGKQISTHYVQVRINGDVALLKGVMKEVLAIDAERGDVLDRAFIAEHTVGFEAFAGALEAVDFDALTAESGVSRETMRSLAEIYARSERVIVCWAMGLTQHKNGVANVREIVNLLLLRGNLGRRGAGVCPVRGHSNVQGDRTVGILESPKEAFLARLDAAVGMTSPRHHGVDAVGAVQAMEAGSIEVFVALGGNFVAAMSDTARTTAALRDVRFAVHVATKLNRSHLDGGRTSIILPCLGRSEKDAHDGNAQFVTVENSMGIVHRSEGHLSPADPSLWSEPRIVAGIASATLGATRPVDWAWLAADYDRIRDLLEKAISGFDDYNRRVREPGGFYLPNGARERTWSTASGKAEFTVQELPRIPLEPGQLLLMTIRSHDQFNTTVYGLDDRYRGVRGDRNVVFMNRDDMTDRGLAEGQRIDVFSHYAGQTRTVRGFSCIGYDVPRGCAAAYFPETNALVALENHADESRTPASKSIVISVQPAREPAPAS